jgi:hypothetical protein
MDARHQRHPTVVTCCQADDLDAAPYANARLALRHCCEHMLSGRPSSRHRDEALVSRPGRPVCDSGRHTLKRIDQRCTCGDQCVTDIGHFAVEHPADARLQKVRLSKLNNARTRPARPRLFDCVWHRLGVALEYRDIVAVARKHHRGCETANASTQHDHLRH